MINIYRDEACLLRDEFERRCKELGTDSICAVYVHEKRTLIMRV
jgi:hypothetical protein